MPATRCATSFTCTGKPKHGADTMHAATSLLPAAVTNTVVEWCTAGTGGMAYLFLHAVWQHA